MSRDAHTIILTRALRTFGYGCTSVLLAQMLTDDVFAVSESYPKLLVAAFVGTVSPSTNDNTPFSGVEQVPPSSCSQRAARA